jgi:hypothetical protein
MLLFVLLLVVGIRAKPIFEDNSRLMMRMRESMAEHVWQDKEAEGATSHHQKSNTLLMITGDYSSSDRTVVIYLLV